MLSTHVSKRSAAVGVIVALVSGTVLLVLYDQGFVLSCTTTGAPGTKLLKKSSITTGDSSNSTTRSIKPVQAFEEVTFYQPFYSGAKHGQADFSDGLANVSDSEISKCITFFDNQNLRLGVEPVKGFLKYRLGDCIKVCRGCIQKNNAFNGTFARMYQERACPSSPNNFTIVQEIVSRKDGMECYLVPDPEAVIIHLRLGDVIERSKQNISTLLLESGTPWHKGHFRGAIRGVYQYLEELHKTKATKVEIVGGSHETYDGDSKSVTYAHCLHYALHKGGYNTTMRIGGVNPDQDFYYMTHAKKIMVSSGGYSRLLGQMAVLNGGEILGQTW